MHPFKLTNYQPYHYAFYKQTNLKHKSFNERIEFVFLFCSLGRKNFHIVDHIWSWKFSSSRILFSMKAFQIHSFTQRWLAHNLSSMHFHHLSQRPIGPTFRINDLKIDWNSLVYFSFTDWVKVARLWHTKHVLSKIWHKTWQTRKWSHNLYSRFSLIILFGINYKLFIPWLLLMTIGALFYFFFVFFLRCNQIYLIFFSWSIR